MKHTLANQISQRRRAFSLIELLVVIAIIAVLAAMLLAVAGSLSKTKKISVAQAEIQLIETALENYKAKYGVYPPANPANAVANQLFYELTGVTSTTVGGTSGFQTLDGLYFIPVSSFTNTFGGVGGVINCSKGSGEDAVLAKNFLPGLRSTQITSATNANNLVVYLATSVAGPDVNYHPAYASGFNFEGNPFRYVYPGTNNPNSYDLWVQLSIGSTATVPGTSNKKYLICNWKTQVEQNSPLP